MHYVDSEFYVEFPAKMVRSVMPKCSADRAARRERALLSLDGLSVGDGFGERFFGPTAQMESRIAARLLPGGTWWYTDDTAMALSIVEVLVKNDRIDQAQLAQAFVRRFAEEPERGYGGGGDRDFARHPHGGTVAAGSGERVRRDGLDGEWGRHARWTAGRLFCRRHR